MKNKWESPEIFAAYAAIDFAYYQIGELQKLFHKPVATGDKAETERYIRQSLELCETIIENKKIIEADYADTEMLRDTILAVQQTMAAEKTETAD
jgi:phosphate uptake regulator